MQIFKCDKSARAEHVFAPATAAAGARWARVANASSSLIWRWSSKRLKLIECIWLRRASCRATLSGQCGIVESGPKTNATAQKRAPQPHHPIKRERARAREGKNQKEKGKQTVCHCRRRRRRHCGRFCGQLAVDSIKRRFVSKRYGVM